MDESSFSSHKQDTVPWTTGQEDLPSEASLKQLEVKLVELEVEKMPSFLSLPEEPWLLASLKQLEVKLVELEVEKMPSFLSLLGKPWWLALMKVLSSVT